MGMRVVEVPEISQRLISIKLGYERGGEVELYLEMQPRTYGARLQKSHAAGRHNHSCSLISELSQNQIPSCRFPMTTLNLGVGMENKAVLDTVRVQAISLVVFGEVTTGNVSQRSVSSPFSPPKGKHSSWIYLVENMSFNQSKGCGVTGRAMCAWIGVKIPSPLYIHNELEVPTHHHTGNPGSSEKRNQTDRKPIGRMKELNRWKSHEARK